MSTPVSVMLPVVLPAGIVIEMSDAVKFVVCAAEPVKPKIIVTGTAVADESVAVTVSVPPSSGSEGFANDRLTVGSPLKVAVTVMRRGL